MPKRAVHDRLVAAAAFLTIVLAVTLLASGPGSARSSRASGPAADSGNALTFTLTHMEFARGLVSSEGVSAVVATHDPLLLDVADRVVELRDGSLVSSAP